MIVRRFSLLAVLLLSAPCVLVGCSADATTAGADGDSENEQDLTSCANPTRYFVAFVDGKCSEILGAGGSWVPTPAFADEPADASSATCLLSWHGSSQPDGEALSSRVHFGDAMVPACGASRTPTLADPEAIAEVEKPKTIGAAGCDVCGIVIRGSAWVILPPDRIDVREFQVRLSTGASEAFKIPDAKSRALHVVLPSRPAGTSYVDGRFAIY